MVVAGAVAGSDVAYLTMGLPYKASVWETQWPVVMRNTIDACRASGSKLVFFDNIYMYDRDHLSPMDEDTPVRPTTRKGAVRAKIADMLMEAAQKGEAARTGCFQLYDERCRTAFTNVARGEGNGVPVRPRL